ncbi:MAG: hypothetical protein QM831_06900 [Kofleriaceae bacterium]
MTSWWAVLLVGCSSPGNTPMDAPRAIDSPDRLEPLQADEAVWCNFSTGATGVQDATHLFGFAKTGSTYTINVIGKPT